MSRRSSDTFHHASAGFCIYIRINISFVIKNLSGTNMGWRAGTGRTREIPLSLWLLGECMHAFQLCIKSDSSGGPKPEGGTANVQFMSVGRWTGGWLAGWAWLLVRHRIILVLNSAYKRALTVCFTSSVGPFLQCNEQAYAVALPSSSWVKNSRGGPFHASSCRGNMSCRAGSLYCSVNALSPRCYPYNALRTKCRLARSSG